MEEKNLKFLLLGVLLFVLLQFSSGNTEDNEVGEELEILKGIFGSDAIERLPSMPTEDQVEALLKQGNEREAKAFQATRKILGTMHGLNGALRSVPTDKLRSLINYSDQSYGGQSALSSKLTLDNLQYNAAKYFAHSNPFGAHDFWVHRTALLADIAKILQDPGLLKDIPFGEKTLEKLYYVLIYVQIKAPHKEKRCPYGYSNTPNGLCLIFDLHETPTTWLEAEEYCKEKKGGQLVIFRDANDFFEVRKFLSECFEDSPGYRFWIGATDKDTESLYYQLDGSLLKLGVPFWATGEPDTTDSATKDYAVLLPPDYLISSDVLAGTANTIPLCQYIPERDGEIVFQTQNTGFSPWIVSGSTYSGSGSGGGYQGSSSSYGKW